MVAVPLQLLRPETCAVLFHAFCPSSFPQSLPFPPFPPFPFLPFSPPSLPPPLANPVIFYLQNILKFTHPLYLRLLPSCKPSSVTCPDDCSNDLPDLSARKHPLLLSVSTAEMDPFKLSWIPAHPRSEPSGDSLLMLPRTKALRDLITYPARPPALFPLLLPRPAWCGSLGAFRDERVWAALALFWERFLQSSVSSLILGEAFPRPPAPFSLIHFPKTFFSSIALNCHLIHTLYFHRSVFKRIWGFKYHPHKMYFFFFEARLPLPTLV